MIVSGEELLLAKKVRPMADFRHGFVKLEADDLSGDLLCKPVVS